MFVADRPNPSLVHTVSTRHLPATKRSFPKVNYTPLLPCGEFLSLRCGVEPHRGLVPPRSFEIRYQPTSFSVSGVCLLECPLRTNAGAHIHHISNAERRGWLFQSPIDSLFRPPCPPCPPVSMIESKPCPEPTSNLGYLGPWPVRSWLPRESRPRTPSHHVSQARSS